jgi:hypothetical protein
MVFLTRDKWAVTMTWRVLRLRMEERPQICRVAANVLNKQSRTADKRWSSSWGGVEVLKTLDRKNVSCYEILTQQTFYLEWYLGYELSNGKGT